MPGGGQGDGGCTPQELEGDGDTAGRSDPRASPSAGSQRSKEASARSRGQTPVALDPPPALRFEGGLVCLGSPALLGGGPPLTLDCWVRFRAVGDGVSQTLVWHACGDGTVALLWQLHGAELRVAWVPVDPDPLDEEPEWASLQLLPTDKGRWVHVAAVCDGAAWTVHRDGTPGEPAPAGCARAPTSGEASEWFIGRSPESAQPAPLRADLRDFRVWRSALSTRRLGELARGATPAGSDGALLCFLRCNEGDGRVASDSAAWGDSSRVQGELRGTVGWVGRDRPGAHCEGAVEEEPDLTTLDEGDEGDPAAASTQPLSHACVDRQQMWARLRELPVTAQVRLLRATHLLVARLYARALVVEALAGWPDGVPMQAGTLGGAAGLCALLRALTDASEPAAGAVVKARLMRLLHDASPEERSTLLPLLLDDALELLNDAPQCTVRESPHPYAPGPGGVVRCVAVPGRARYRVLFDPRCAHDVALVTVDESGRRAIARYAAGRSGPYPPLEITLPKFYYHFKAGTSWGYKFTVEFAYERFELGLELLQAVVGFCAAAGCSLPRSVAVFNALLQAIAHASSQNRRQLFSVMRQLVCSRANWTAGQRPRLGDLTPLRLALERQYRRETSSGGCVMHSKFVQSLTELFLAVKDAELVWTGLAAGELDSEEGAQLRRQYGADCRQGPEQVRLLAREELRIDVDDDDHTVAVWSENSNTVPVVTDVALLRGRWYFEVRLLTPGAFTVGLQSSCAPSGALCGSAPRTWGWDLRRCAQLDEGRETPFPADRQARLQLKDVVGVAVDLTTPEQGRAVLTLNGQPLGEGCSIGLRPGEALVPALALRSNEGAILNFGSTYFEYEPPEGGFLPLEVSDLALGHVLPFNQVRAFVDLSHCFLHARPLPPFFHDPTDHFSAEAAAGDRIGPPNVELVSDGTGIITNGLECRNTGTAFYSVKANVKVSRGTWYYEVTLATHGLMQVGWASDRSQAKPVAGIGVGDDAHSWGLDLFRRLRWHRNEPHGIATRKWAAGDVLGCAIVLPGDGQLGCCSFTLNGEPVLSEDGSEVIFRNVRAGEGVYPAATFRADNGCTFNFGGSPLRYRPAGFRALGVADTWLERIDAFYSQAGADWVHTRHELAQRPVARRDAAQEWDLARDEELVSLVNGLCRAQKKNLHQVSLERGFGGAGEEKKGLQDRAGSASEEVWARHPLLHEAAPGAIRERVGALNKFNRLVYTVIPLINFEMQHGHEGTTLSAAEALMRVRGLIFQSVADDIIKGIVKATNGIGEPIRMILNRRKAARHRQVPEEDPTGRASLFGQTVELLGGHPPQMFKTAHRFWSVVFTGEGAEDVGGPFREHITEMCSELMSAATPLFIPSPNQRTAAGTHRDGFVPRPSAVSAANLRQYEFLGRLMGGALRSNEPLSLYLPPLVWKGVAGHALSKADLEGVDKLCLQCIENFTTLAEQGVTEEMFNRTFATETFSTQLSDGTTVELYPGGADVAVTFDTRDEYASLVARTRLRESERQIQAIRRGLCAVIPKPVLYLTTWRELEVKVCGRADFSVRELKELTTFDGLTKDDRRVTFLWEVLGEITAADRRAFLRFVSGRERLPVKLRVMPLFCKGAPDSYLPKAATCFFALELPNYSSVEVLREKLLYAIQHCSDIDTDFRAREFDEDQGPALGFDDPGARLPLPDEDFDNANPSDDSGLSLDDWGDEV
eukprot:TRINITY_DN55934_c0_g1_i1.p1 TRINITY_DN55934_c0_g1~~TRINITY_DN55934_c0_g1_i1.p1  ORF type:complete len:1846 (+),score=599.58 TRINITY_DN55934_c0_g1_i1:433-5538(+)